MTATHKFPAPGGGPRRLHGPPERHQCPRPDQDAPPDHDAGWLGERDGFGSYSFRSRICPIYLFTPQIVICYHYN